VCASFARLLEDGNRQWLTAVLLLQLREAERRGQARRSSADNQDVNVEGLASHTV
jgi:hypothetical protein